MDLPSGLPDLAVVRASGSLDNHRLASFALGSPCLLVEDLG